MDSESHLRKQREDFGFYDEDNRHARTRGRGRGCPEENQGALTREPREDPGERRYLKPCSKLRA